jgi:hypothetical protein
MGAAENPAQAPNAVHYVILLGNYPDGRWRDFQRDLWAATFFLPPGALVRVNVSRVPWAFAYDYPWFRNRPDISWQFVGRNANTWGFLAAELFAGRHPLGPLGRMV